MDNKRSVALVETKTKDETVSPNMLPSTIVRYQLSNHLGSASLELDDNGAVISYEEYYPYGSTSYQAGRSVAEVSLKRYRYSGKERDVETSLYYHGARYYAPWLARWTATDPTGLKDGINLYAAMRGSPLRYSDPQGTTSYEEALQSVEDLTTSAKDTAKKMGERISKQKLLSESLKKVKSAEEALNKEFLNWQLQNPNATTIPAEINKKSIELEQLYKQGRELTGELVGLEKKIERGHKILPEILKKLEEAKIALKKSEIGRRIEIATKETKGVAKEGKTTIYRSADEASALAKQTDDAVIAATKSAEDLKKMATAKDAKAIEKIEKAAAKSEKEILELEKAALKAEARTTSGLLKRVSKYLPFIGIGIAVGLVTYDIKHGEYFDAALDAVSPVPVVGEVVMAGQLTATTGQIFGNVVSTGYINLCMEFSRGPMGHF